MTRILIVDDEPQILRALRINLTARQYDVVTAADGAQALAAAREDRPDIVVLDLGLPDIDGVEVIHDLRTWTPVPIVVLSGRVDSHDKIDALDAGADDYVTKPFSAPELLARLRAALRREVRGAAPTALLQFGHVRVDLARREATGADGELHLTPLEYRVLTRLARNLGSIVMQQQLIREVWGPERQDDSRGLRVCIKNLRAKLEPDPRQPRYLITETGLGYRLRADIDAPTQTEA
jgi:two-component system, OmpR family, KDP operon response regulator KdpE